MLSAVTSGRQPGDEAEPARQPAPMQSADDVGPDVDLDDMFGLRHALSMLPEPSRDAFVERWAELVQECRYDLRLLSTAATREARAQARSPGMESAWAMVARSMHRYVEWRFDDDEPGSPEAELA